jgi:hypothetical protein
MFWELWFRDNWEALTAGHVPVPTWLPHPSQAGFRRLQFSTPSGQVADWGLSLTDRSRIHVHQHADGRLVAHRDKYDPDAGLGSLLAHVFTETGIGKLALVVGVVMAAGSLLESGAGS